VLFCVEVLAIIIKVGIFVPVVQQGKRGGRTFRQRTQIRENTPDASGNVLHLLEQMIGEKLATKQSVKMRFIASP